MQKLEGTKLSEKSLEVYKHTCLNLAYPINNKIFYLLLIVYADCIICIGKRIISRGQRVGIIFLEDGT
jgi:hypothetical protein